MATAAPLVVNETTGNPRPIASTDKLGPFANGTASGEALTAGADLGTPSAGMLTNCTGLPVIGGGTGQSSYTDGQLLIGNSTGNTLNKATLTGTASQVNVANGPGSITLSLPQNIDTAALLRVARMGIGVAASGSASALLCVGGNPTNFTGANYVNVTDSSAGGALILSKDSTNYSVIQYSAASSAFTFATIEAGTPYSSTIGCKVGNVIVGGLTPPATATRNLVLSGGATSPVLGSATADIVSQAAVDNGAGNREWQAQPETGGRIAYGSDNLRRVPSSTQDCQQAIKTVNTTDATQTTLHTIPITSGRTYFIESTIIARRTGGASGTADDGASYVRRGTYTTKSGTVTLMGSVQTIGTDAEDQAGWDVTFTISGSNVLVRVTGASANNVTWMSDTAIKSVAS